MHFKFLTRSIKHLTSHKKRREGCRLHFGGGGSMVDLFCKKLPQLWEKFLFIREMNEPMMAIRGKAFHNYLYPWSCAS